ncbi:MAG: class I SAM-dependent methyltransferase [Myxococcota bacterium]
MEQGFQRDYHSSERSHWWSVARRDMVLRLLHRYDIGGGTRVMDVGCSSGRLVAALEAEGVEAHGVDVSQAAVDACHADGLYRIRLRPADDIDAPDDHFDAVIASDVLEHLDDDVAALREWHRILRPGGRLFAFVPAHMMLWSEHDEINHHRRRYSRDRLSDAFAAVPGLRVERLSGWNGLLLPPVAAVRTLQRFAGNERREHDFKPTHPWVNRALTALLRAENRYLTRRDAPTGVSLFAVARKERAH